MKNAIIRLIERSYRRTKVALLTRKPPVITEVFFRSQSILDRFLSRRATPRNRKSNILWVQDYLDSYANGRPCFNIETDHPVALGSADHLHPRGAISDNSVNYRFNLKVYELLRGHETISLMDLGCAGGGLVRSFLQDGHTAIGLEGSDAPKRMQTGEWGTIPFNLYTCDITRPFRVTLGGQPFQFDVITAWEVLEHIPETSVAGLIDSISLHLRPGGYFIGSVDLLPDGNPLTGAVYHLTLKPASWWEQRFREKQLVKVQPCPFAPEDMVRGNGLSLKDWSPDDSSGIHLVLQKAPGERAGLG